MKVLNYGIRKEFADRYDAGELLRDNRLTAPQIVEDIKKSKVRKRGKHLLFFLFHTVFFPLVYGVKYRSERCKTSFFNCGLSGFRLRAVRLPTAGSSVANCKTKKRNRYSDIMYGALRHYI